MENFFNAIYSVFCDTSLGVYQMMESIVDAYGDTLLSSYLPLVGITTILISFAVAIAFYIWPINHPRFKAWWAWLIMLFVNLLVNFGLTFAMIKMRISSIIGEENADLIDTVLEKIPGDKENLDFSFYEQLQFVMSNVLFSAICFVFASLIFNWFSTNCKFSPFRK